MLDTYELPKLIARGYVFSDASSIIATGVRHLRIASRER